MIVVCNTTPLIGLSVIGRFDLLHHLFGTIHILEAVYDEAVIFGREQGGAKQEVSSASWIKRHTVYDRSSVDLLLKDLDLGESEVIALVQQLGATLVLMDERKGRKKLAELGISKIGTLGILMKAKEVGLLSTIRGDIELLHQEGFSISQTIIEATLHQVGE
ncbi:MAG: DUF3368 domain-containing protein [Leptolyngbyaceae bacterium]|nr:DUF3368 domain-containing protein [Leptolyngbyaceae bacterium]